MLSLKLRRSGHYSVVVPNKGRIELLCDEKEIYLIKEEREIVSDILFEYAWDTCGTSLYALFREHPLETKDGYEIAA